MQFSRRLLPDLEETPFFKKLESLKVQIKNYSDLTISTPMNAGITPDFSSAFQKVSFAFSPNASGSSKTREQIVSYYKERGGNFSADSVLLTCSTSEAYSILFKAFCNPGDVILTPVPGYPLLDTLAQLEFLKCYPYFLKQKENRFVVDTDSFLSAPERAKIFLLVSPHNPTGHVVSPSEWNAILDFCEERKLILIVDEVFGDYLYFEKVKRSWLYKKAKIPVFYLNGLSKIAGAPSIKLGWILSEVPPLYKQKIQNVLEFVFDAYLNVSAIAESIAVPLLQNSFAFQKILKIRLQNNLKTLYEIFENQVPGILGGWYALIPIEKEDETFVLDLLEKKQILVQPGFFFDFEENWIVVSLLPEESVFKNALIEIKNFLNV